MSEQPFGHIILEGNNDVGGEITNLQVFDKPHLFYIRFDTILQSLDCRNRNGRFYNGDALVKGLSTPEIAELIANNKWKGERDHPVTKDIQRIASVLSKNCSHRIVKWWRDGNLIRATIETLDDGGNYGTQLTRNILQKENPSFSLRALAVLEKKGTTTYVNRPPRVITYDEVNLPSHKEAYAEPRKEKILTDGKEVVTYEAVDSVTNKKIHVINGSIAIEAVDIKDMLLKKSDNLKVVCESFDIDPSTVMLTNGGKSLTAKNGSDTLVWTLESNLCRETTNLWKYIK